MRTLSTFRTTPLLTIALLGAFCLPAQALIGGQGQGVLGGGLQGASRSLSTDAFGEARGGGRLALDGERLRQRSERGSRALQERAGGVGGGLLANGQGSAGMADTAVTGAGSLAGTLASKSAADSGSPVPPAGPLMPNSAEAAPAAQPTPAAPSTSEAVQPKSGAQLGGEGQVGASGPRDRQLQAGGAAQGNAQRGQGLNGSAQGSVRAEGGRR
jgi:hypothetical protein